MVARKHISKDFIYLARLTRWSDGVECYSTILMSTGSFERRTRNSVEHYPNRKYTGQLPRFARLRLSDEALPASPKVMILRVDEYRTRKLFCIGCQAPVPAYRLHHCLEFLLQVYLH